MLVRLSMQLLSLPINKFDCRAWGAVIKSNISRIPRAELCFPDSRFSGVTTSNSKQLNRTRQSPSFHVLSMEGRYSLHVTNSWYKTRGGMHSFCHSFINKFILENTIFLGWITYAANHSFSCKAIIDFNPINMERWKGVLPINLITIPSQCLAVAWKCWQRYHSVGHNLLGQYWYSEDAYRPHTNYTVWVPLFCENVFLTDCYCKRYF